MLGDPGNFLERIADRIEGCLLDLSSLLVPEEEDALAWDVSALSDLNPYGGTLQLNATRCIFMIETVKSGGQHIFLVDDDDAGQAQARAVVANGQSAKWVGDVQSGGSVLQKLRARLSMVRQIMRHRCVVRRLRRNAQVRWDDLKNCDVLVLDWAKPSTFSSETPTGRVSNLERMPEVLRNGGLKVGYLANPLHWLFPFEDIAQGCFSANDPVVLVDECLSPLSMLKGAWRTWRQERGLKRQVTCGGYDVTDVVRLEFSRDVLRTQGTRSYAYGDVAKTLAKHGLSPKAIVYTYENQGWERTLIRGFREHFPDCRLIGYQHCPFAMRMISFFPSPWQVRDNVIPDELVVMGPYYAEQLAARGFPRERLKNGGSLRFEGLYARPPVRRQGQEAQDAGHAVLCATSVEYSESLNLVLKAAQAVKGLHDTTMIVTFHPKVSETFIENIIAETNADVRGAEAFVSFSRQSTSSLLPTVDVLLYNNSGAAFEALMGGIGTVFVSVDGALDYDKIPDEIARRASSAEELKATLAEMMSNTGQPQKGGDKSVGGCIAPVDEAAIVRAVRGV